jgi:hypothetical protein
VQEDSLDFLQPHLASLKTLVVDSGLPKKHDYQVGVSPKLKVHPAILPCRRNGKILCGGGMRAFDTIDVMPAGPHVLDESGAAGIQWQWPCSRWEAVRAADEPTGQVDESAVSTASTIQ